MFTFYCILKHKDTFRIEQAEEVPVNKRCTNSSCRKTFSTLIYGGKCPFCGKVYPQIRQGWKNGAAVDVELIDMGPKKIRVIKLVREGTGLGLRETKELVESAPVLIRTSIPINEAKALKRKLEDTGARVSLTRYIPARQEHSLGKWVNVELTDFGPKKIKVVKVVRQITGLGLRDTKLFVESAPVLIYSGVSVKRAKALKEQIEETGASVTLIRGKKGRRNNKRTFLRSDHKG